MNANVRALLRRLEEQGLHHDASEPEHARRFLNLEPATAEVVAILLQIAGSRRVLEIGTSNGYSTIWLAATLSSQGGRITSIDRDVKKHALARENLAKVDLLRYVDLHVGDATEIAAGLTGAFDCLFFDGDRISAPKQLEILLPRLSRPALLMADNALSHPDQIAAYLSRVEQIKGVSHTVIPVGKGLSVAHLSA
jgi:predicted O-methyltransferase YrrM